MSSPVLSRPRGARFNAVSRLEPVRSEREVHCSRLFSCQLRFIFSASLWRPSFLRFSILRVGQAATDWLAASSWPDSDESIRSLVTCDAAEGLLLRPRPCHRRCFSWGSLDTARELEGREEEDIVKTSVVPIGRLADRPSGAGAGIKAVTREAFQ